jgi:N-acetylmuramoyl-L-alanine amidase
MNGDKSLLLPTTSDISKLPIKTFKILLVPGHDPKEGGANFKDIYERDLAVIIANKIEQILNEEEGYSVLVTRDMNDWNPIFFDYFKNNEKDILDFKNKKQAEDKLAMSSGKKKFVPDMAMHSEVNKKTAVELYGINKWSNENNINLVLHIHFNDSERNNMNYPGEYKGFTIFIPEKQMSNSSTSRGVAENIYEELKNILIPEVIGNQKSSLIEDQSLIALGSSGTLDNTAALLVECGYIYEKIFRTKEDREIIMEKIAERTVTGIKKYVNLMRNNE